jgi:hypothetical protein
MGYQPTRKGWVRIPRGVDPNATPGQLSILEGRRFDPTGVAVKLRYPPGFARTHSVAAALGREKRKDGTYGALRHGKDGVGVLIGPTQRKRICAVLSITPDHFSDFARTCETKNIGHRCQWGVLFLWLEPFLEFCSGCGEEVLQSTGNRSGNSQALVRQSAGNSVPISGDALRDGEGDADRDAQKNWDFIRSDDVEGLKHVIQKRLTLHRLKEHEQAYLAEKEGNVG